MEAVWLAMFVGLVVAFITPFVLLGWDAHHGTHLSCTYFGWHNGDGGHITFDGASNQSHCSKCGAKVLQDGQGNWFEI